MDSAELKFILYRAVCLTTGKAYIGQTRSTLPHRWSQHVHTAERGGRGSPALHAAIRKYGAKAFEIEELARVHNVGDANALEMQLIAQHGTLAPAGYNLALGGAECERTPETRAKISAAHKGMKKPWSAGPQPAAKRAAISKAKRGKQPRGAGWKHSPETRARMALAARERAHGQC